MDAVLRGFWWPGLYGDVRRWCSKCEFCHAKKGVSGLSAWMRTGMYSCPSRVLQFDAITRQEKFMLTCVCCFSRWAWLLPISNKEAETIAKALMNIFCDARSFPTVLRSDNAAELTGDVARRLNKMFGIKHTTGTAYHPQSQGAVERMQKILHQYVHGIVQGEADKWEDSLTYATMILRSAPMACLGGRRPYGVVTGLKPRSPQRILCGLPVEACTVDKYAQDLLIHLKEVRSSVQRTPPAASARDETTLAGRISAEEQLMAPTHFFDSKIWLVFIR